MLTVLQPLLSLQVGANYMEGWNLGNLAHLEISDKLLFFIILQLLILYLKLQSATDEPDSFWLCRRITWHVRNHYKLTLQLGVLGGNLRPLFRGRIWRPVGSLEQRYRTGGGIQKSYWPLLRLPHHFGSGLQYQGDGGVRDRPFYVEGWGCQQDHHKPPSDTTRLTRLPVSEPARYSDQSILQCLQE